MKREGRQHGMVRTYPTEPGSRSQRTHPGNPAELTAGTFTRVPSKPTNHSKFTGKCGRRKCTDCHVTPASKSKDKVKGAQKTRSSPEVLITWRVVDALPGFNVSGFKSATAVLSYLDDDHHEDSDHESYDHHGIEELIIDGHDSVDHGHEIEEIDGHDDDDDDGMSFCEVGFVWQEIEGDESWCFVEEM